MSTPLNKLFLEEVSLCLRDQSPAPFKIITENNIAHLPSPVQRYLRYAGFLGKPLPVNVQVEWEEAFLRPAPDKKWMSMDCLQVNFAFPPARVVYMNARLFGVLPFEGRDKYQQGRGSMLIRLLRFLAVGDARGAQMDISALVTLLAELPLLPAYALEPGITWEAVDNTTTRAIFCNHGLEVSGTFHFAEEGPLLSFTTNDRYMAKGRHYIRHTWSADAAHYECQNDIRHPSVLSATWHSEAGDFTYFKGKIRRLRFDIKELAIPDKAGQ